MVPANTLYRVELSPGAAPEPSLGLLGVAELACLVWLARAKRSKARHSLCRASRPS